MGGEVRNAGAYRNISDVIATAGENDQIAKKKAELTLSAFCTHEHFHDYEYRVTLPVGRLASVDVSFFALEIPLEGHCNIKVNVFASTCKEPV